jgi:hypothetical protein
MENRFCILRQRSSPQNIGVLIVFRNNVFVEYDIDNFDYCFDLELIFSPNHSAEWQE